MSTEDLRGPREVLGCLVDDCTWTYERTRPTQLLAPTAATLRDIGPTDVHGPINAAIMETVRHANRLFDQACREHLESHDVVEWAATIARLSAEVERLNSRTPVVEHAIRMSGGTMEVRNAGEHIERIYPLAEWIPDHQRFGGKVFTRTVIVVEDWHEVPR